MTSLDQDMILNKFISRKTDVSAWMYYLEIGKKTYSYPDKRYEDLLIFLYRLGVL